MARSYPICIAPLVNSSGISNIDGDWSSGTGTPTRFSFTPDVGRFYYITALRIFLNDDAAFESKLMDVTMTKGIKIGVEKEGSSGSFEPYQGIFTPASSDFTSIKTLRDLDCLADRRELYTHDLTSTVYRSGVWDILFDKAIELDRKDTTLANRDILTAYLSDDMSGLLFGRIMVKYQESFNQTDRFDRKNGR